MRGSHPDNDSEPATVGAETGINRRSLLRGGGAAGRVLPKRLHGTQALPIPVQYPSIRVESCRHPRGSNRRRAQDPTYRPSERREGRPSRIEWVVPRRLSSTDRLTYRLQPRLNDPILRGRADADVNLMRRNRRLTSTRPRPFLRTQAPLLSPADLEHPLEVRGARDGARPMDARQAMGVASVATRVRAAVGIDLQLAPRAGTAEVDQLADKAAPEGHEPTNPHPTPTRSRARWSTPKAVETQ